MKNLFLSTVFILVNIFSFGQAELSLGVKLGANYSSFDVSQSDYSFLDSKMSFSGGAFLRVGVDRVSLQGELLYSTYQAELEDQASNIVKSGFSSVDFPILLGYKLIDAKVFKMRMNGGITASTGMSAYSGLNKSYFENSFVSWTAGVSFDIPIFLIDVRYSGGIDDFYSQGNMSTNVLNFSVGWKFL